MNIKPIVYLTSNVFKEITANDKINVSIRNSIKNLWNALEKDTTLYFFDGRFPDDDQLKNDIKKYKPNILGCHLSHPISSEMIKMAPIFAIATSTAGYNHIQRNKEDDILITHTPGVLHYTVADYTIALIMSNLRNLIDLHNYVWDGNWKETDKWDLDRDLSAIINNKILGIIGLGEIGTEVLKRLHPWGVKIYYFDVNRNEKLEKEFPGLEFKGNLESIFKEADIISLHIPLNNNTKNLINQDLLKLMKKNSLLVNTARGGIVNFDDLLTMLENKEIEINIAFDVFPNEPIDDITLNRFKNIKKKIS
ncbi:MAG: 2-hydroxyacid dehydrogenase [Promethearchaeota archaeon]